MKKEIRERFELVENILRYHKQWIKKLERAQEKPEPEWIIDFRKHKEIYDYLNGKTMKRPEGIDKILGIKPEPECSIGHTTVICGRVRCPKCGFGFDVPGNKYKCPKCNYEPNKPDLPLHVRVHQILGYACFAKGMPLGSDPDQALRWAHIPRYDLERDKAIQALKEYCRDNMSNSIVNLNWSRKSNTWQVEIDSIVGKDCRELPLAICEAIVKHAEGR